MVIRLHVLTCEEDVMMTDYLKEAESEIVFVISDYYSRL